METSKKTRRRLSPDEIDEIVRLRERGHSYEWIGGKLGCSGANVSWHCCRLAVEPPKPSRTSWDAIKGPAFYVSRTGVTVRRFTPEEDQVLLTMRSNGARVCDIAQRLGRGGNSIIGRLNTLARREARREAAA